MRSAISDCIACPLDRKCPDCTVYSRALSRDTQLHGIAPTHGGTGAALLFPLWLFKFGSDAP